MKLEMRMVPFSMEDTVGIQGWLQGLARQGLILDSCDNGTFMFKRGEAAPLRYRVDPTKGHPVSGPPRALRDLYGEYGWKYVDSYNRFSHVFVTEDPNAPEPFHSPEALAQSMRSATRRRILYWSVFLLLEVLGILFLFWRKTFDLYAVHSLLMTAIGVGAVVYHIRTALSQKEKVKIPGILDQSPSSSRFMRWMQVSTIFLISAYLLYHIFT